MTIGKQIQLKRKEKKITQQQLADIIGVKRAAISKYEKDLVDVPYSKLIAIAQALEVELSELLNWDRPIDDMDKGVLEIYPNFNPKYGYISDMVNGEYPTKVKKVNLQKDTVSKLGTLNALGQQKANEYITDLSEQEKYTKPDEE